MAEIKFPTEMVNLPSKGWFYDSANPLSSGEVEVKYMTAKEEDILTSTNLIKKGIVFDRLLQALIVDKKIGYCFCKQWFRFFMWNVTAVSNDS